mgnify:FL=1
MTYLVKKIGSHLHQWFIDSISGDKICLCGATKGINEKRKYHNHSMTYNGHTYHSKLEANYAAELDLRVRAGDIQSWERQVKLDLKVNDYHIANYYIDFIVLHKNGTYEFCEVKGMEMDLWKMKWKILEATFDDHKRTLDDWLTVIKEVNTRYR